MNTVELLAILFSLLILIRSLQNGVNLKKSIKWLTFTPQANRKPSTRFIICIPVLNEQDTIVRTIKNFLDQKYSKELIDIYVVTTEKEERQNAKLSTQEVVEEYRASLSDQDKQRLHVLHYPHVNGLMSHQINYLAHHLRQELNDDAYFTIYNADSNINDDVFMKVDSVIDNSLNKPTLLQQSAIYQYGGKSSFMGRIAEGAGLHQSLWTLTHEIPRLLRQSAGLRVLGNSLEMSKILLNSRIAHCVGHGLFVRGSYYIKHPLSEDVLNEDLPYGLMACALREPIYSIPSLELASTPSKLANVYKQKSVWFNPFFEFHIYGKELETRGLYKSRRELWFLVFQAYIPLVIWLLHSFVAVGGLILGALAGWLYVFVWLMAFSLYWFIPAIYVTRKRKEIANGGSNSYISILAGSVYAMSHSIGPIWSILRWIPAFFKGAKPNKPKTETV
jgi:glycosyltransferase involved in cell wall biosynthesis